MSSQTGIVSNTSGTLNWTNTSQIFVSNNVYATTSSAIGNTATSGFLMCLGNGFNVPNSATIDGIALIVEAKQQASGNDGFQVRPTSGDIRLRLSGANIGAQIVSTADGMTIQSWTGGVDQSKTFGSPTNLWNTTLTPAIVNNTTFGVSVRFRNNNTSQVIYVDRVVVIVYFTEGGIQSSQQLFMSMF